MTAYRPLPRLATRAFRAPAKTDGGRFGAGATVSDPVHVPTAMRAPCSATTGREAPDATHERDTEDERDRGGQSHGWLYITNS